MSEQPASVHAERERSATRQRERSILDRRHWSLPFRQIEHVPGERPLLGGGDRAAGVSAWPGVTSVLPIRKKSTSFGGRVSSSGVLIGVAGPRRPHETRRHDDGEIGLVLLVRLAGEQRAEHRHAAEPWQLLDAWFWLLFCNRPPITKLWPSRSSTVVEARRTISAGTEMPCDRTGMAVVELAHFRLDLDVDQAVALSTVGVKARPTPYFL